MLYQFDLSALVFHFICLHVFQTKNSIEKLQKEITKICDDARVAVDKIDFSQWKNEIQQIALGKLSPYEFVHKWRA